MFGFTVALAMWWLFYSRQTATDRNAVTAALIVIRLAVVFAVVIGLLHYLLAIPIATLLVPLIVAILWSAVVSLETPPGDGIFDILIWAILVIPFFFAREFVLGFPVRKELVLEPQPDRADAVSLEHLKNKRTTTTSPLRPTGTIEIDGQEYSARSGDGSYIDAGAEVAVCECSGSSLIVTELLPDGAEP